MPPRGFFCRVAARGESSQASWTGARSLDASPCRRRSSGRRSAPMTADVRPHPVWREYLEALLVAGLFLGFTNTFVLKTFYIPSGSMEDTLLVGDHLIVNRYIFGPEGALAHVLPGRSPHRGDVVVFRSPEDPGIDLVKRLIGLPGDHIEMKQKQLFVNDHPVTDDGYAIHRDPRVGDERNAFNYQLYRRDNFGPITVPEGHYFCLGDNRDQSYDSRYWGSVPAHYIKGRAFL